ncbi:histidinol-phosphatase [Liquorilactobacillus ghanensis DSM 18630]|uniref:Histidinol-phosphatase n=1 Tax=Liquorilactobacillus ghanensis DSM 18630 TaxID=1423750 RepID=A0A0R1VMW2_9LACO|nr:histidinol-phosphatase HisJ [Liquorilactobacillus ghanensis]KRM07031.1 histidinol-phosphatase [Liquorilactobacillus ghanensis DSM 18630]
MKIIDGHTHTELCPHGSGEKTAAMIERAIKLGFDKYCITEHAPLPRRFVKDYRGDPAGLTTASLTWNQLDDYFRLTDKLKQQYGSQIEISVGFEVDYLPGYESEIRDFLDQVGSKTEQNILSIHFMPGKDHGLWCVDYTTEDFAAGFSQWLAHPQELYRQYFQLVLQEVTADLGKFRPQRLGHFNLIQKYQDYFQLPAEFDQTNLELLKKILVIIKQQQRELDFNTAGLYKPYCNEFYPGKQITGLAKKLEIPLVFGSDAHAINEVGRGWHLWSSFNN